MMAFANQFVASVLVDGKPQREFSRNGERTIRVPFGSEYKIRLKNNTPRRAMAEVEIDGVNAASAGRKILLRAGQTIDLERFVGDNASGHHFRFVDEKSAAALGQAETNNPSNGLIRVRFYEEATNTWMGLGGVTVRPDPFPYQPVYQGTWNSATPKDGAVGMSSGSLIFSCNSSLRDASAANAGATIEGSASFQRFEDAAGFPTLSNPTTIEIRMLGPELQGSGEKSYDGWTIHRTENSRWIEFNGRTAIVDKASVEDDKLVVVTKDLDLVGRQPETVRSNARLVDGAIELRVTDFLVRWK